MAVTSIYMGSLRYSMNGKKRKNHCANPTRKKPPIVTKQRKPSQSELDRINLENCSAEEKDWMTFRDCDVSFEYLYSDGKAVPLTTKWLDMVD